jgi:hypothetical protein
VITITCDEHEKQTKSNVECGKKAGMVHPSAHEIEVYERLDKELETTVVRELRNKLGLTSENAFF